MNSYTRLLTTAKCELLHHENKSCLSTCLHGLELLSNASQSGQGIVSEDTEDLNVKVAFGILAIQSLALNNQCTKVDSFVEEWFGQVTSLPAEILQICTCLYLQNHDSQSALNITEKWLENKQNHCQHGFEHVVELYIRYILLPMQHTKKAKDFLHNYIIITETTKQRLFLCIERSQLTISNDQDCIGDDSSSSKPGIQQKQTRGGSLSLLLRIIKLCTATKQVLNSVSLKTTLKTGTRLVIILYFMYAVIARTDLPGDYLCGSTSWVWEESSEMLKLANKSQDQDIMPYVFKRGSGPVLLWNAVKQAWTALFAPYHLVPK